MAFRREFRAAWSDFILPDQNRGFHPPELSIAPFTPQQARHVVGVLAEAAHLDVAPEVVERLVDATTVDDAVLPVDIGIGMMVLHEWHRLCGDRVAARRFPGGGRRGRNLGGVCPGAVEPSPRRGPVPAAPALAGLFDRETNQRDPRGLTEVELRCSPTPAPPVSARACSIACGATSGCSR